MTIASLPLPEDELLEGLRLSPYAVAVPALLSHVRPALVLAEHETRALYEAAQRADVCAGGRFAATPSGIQVWDRPWNGPDMSPGSAQHIGTTDWSMDVPLRGYATIYRAIVTKAGAAAGATPIAVLTDVLNLVGGRVDAAQLTPAAPPPRDPFRAGTTG